MLKWLEEKIMYFAKWLIPILFISTYFSVVLFFFFRNKEQHEKVNSIAIVDDYTLWYYIFILIVRALIAFTALIQFIKTNNSLRAECLLKMDERFGSQAIIKARIIINNVYMNIKNSNEHPRTSEEEVIKEVSMEIIKLSESINIKV